MTPTGPAGRSLSQQTYQAHLAPPLIAVTNAAPSVWAESRSPSPTPSTSGLVQGALVEFGLCTEDDGRKIRLRNQWPNGVKPTRKQVTGFMLKFMHNFRERVLLRRWIEIARCLVSSAQLDEARLDRIWDDARDEEWMLVSKYLDAGYDIFYGPDKEILLRSIGPDGLPLSTWRPPPPMTITANMRTELFSRTEPPDSAADFLVEHEDLQSGEVSLVAMKMMLDQDMQATAAARSGHESLGSVTDAFVKFSDTYHFDPVTQRPQTIDEPTPETCSARVALLKQNQLRRQLAVVNWGLEKMPAEQRVALLADTLYQRASNPDPALPLTMIGWRTRMLRMGFHAVKCRHQSEEEWQETPAAIEDLDLPDFTRLDLQGSGFDGSRGAEKDDGEEKIIGDWLKNFDVEEYEKFVDVLDSLRSRLDKLRTLRESLERHVSDTTHDIEKLGRGRNMTVSVARQVYRNLKDTPLECRCKPPAGIDKWSWLEDHLRGLV